MKMILRSFVRAGSLAALIAFWVANLPPNTNAAVLFGVRRQELPQTPSRYNPTEPVVCDSYYTLVDDVIIKWREKNDSRSVLIVISRTGETEPRGIGDARLRGTQSYLNGKQVTFITAQGTPKKGLGQIEFYVGGQLLYAIPVRRGSRRACFGFNG